MSKFVYYILGIFFVGMIGGVFGSQIVWPLLVERPLFYKYKLSQTPTYITETKEVFIQENVALKESIEKVKDTVVAVRSKNLAGRVREGSGLILTSDGLILTLNELLPRGGEFVFIVANAKEPAKYQILKRDPKNNLALVKLELDGLPVVEFSQPEDIWLGKRIFALQAYAKAIEANANSFGRVFKVSEGIVSSLSQELIESTIISEFRGAPVFDVTGNLIGLSYTSSDNKLMIIPVTILKSFAGL